MPIGKIVDAPSTHSSFVRVRDEYGVEYTVHESELPSGANEGDDFAYKVDIWQSPSGNSTTLRASKDEK